MSSPSPILAILASEQDSELANQLAVALGYQSANVVIGTPASGAIFLSQNALPIKYVIIDIGQRGIDVITEIDQLAEQCPEDVRVVVMGATNDNLEEVLRTNGKNVCGIKIFNNASKFCSKV